MYCDKSARKWQITPIKENAKEENEEKSGSGTFSNLKLLQNEQKLREPLFQGEASEAWLEKSFYFLQKNAAIDLIGGRSPINPSNM